MLQIGIIGLPNAGKSTLFNALTKAHAEVAARPFTTIAPNEAIVHVPDERLHRVAHLFQQEKRVPVAIKFVDIAGLVRGAHRGEGLGNQFLSHIREVDAVVHVVRCFDDPSVAHVDGEVNPQRDIETVETELALADLATVDRRIERAKRGARVHEKGAADELAVLEPLRAHLNEGKPARSFVDTGTGGHGDAGTLVDAGTGGRGDAAIRLAIMQELFLLTAKPTLYLANINEATPQAAATIFTHSPTLPFPHSRPLSLPAKLAAEIVELEGEEAETFAREFGLKEGALAQVVRASFELLDVITFYTAVGAEARAWVVPRNTPAPVAAGKIHSDMERGFIRAEVIAFEKLAQAGSWNAARDAGLIETRGKDYPVRDGDVVQFRFHQRTVSVKGQ